MRQFPRLASVRSRRAALLFVVCLSVLLSVLGIQEYMQTHPSFDDNTDDASAMLYVPGFEELPERAKTPDFSRDVSESVTAAKSELLHTLELVEGLGQEKTTEVTGDISQVAQGVLLDYKNLDGCFLACSGWLDLDGTSWGCVVGKEEWVDVCLVSEIDEKLCRLRYIRLERSVWKKRFSPDN